MSTLVLALYVNLSFSAVCRPNLFIDKLILIEYQEIQITDATSYCYLFILCKYALLKNK